MEKKIDLNLIMKLIISILGFILFTACERRNRQDSNIESPFSVVIKLQSAEALLQFDKAKKYIDIESVYSKYIEDSTKTAEDIWKDYLNFNYSISSSSPKFTNVFKYYNYRSNGKKLVAFI